MMRSKKTKKKHTFKFKKNTSFSEKKPILLIIFKKKEVTYKPNY
jgi:hypothetical protein